MTAKCCCYKPNDRHSSNKSTYCNMCSRLNMFCCMRFLQLSATPPTAVLVDYRLTVHSKTLLFALYLQLPSFFIFFLLPPQRCQLQLRCNPICVPFCSVLSLFSTAYLLQPIATLCVADCNSQLNLSQPTSFFNCTLLVSTIGAHC